MQEFFPFAGTFEFWELKSDLELVQEKYLARDVLGSVTFNQLLQKIEDSSHTGTPWEELVRLTRAAAAQLTALYHLPESNISYTPSGLLVSRTEKAVPASEARTRNLELSLRHKSQDLLDWIIRYLQANTAIFTDWLAAENKRPRSAFLPTAFEFNQYYDISENTWVYRKLQDVIIEVENLHLAKFIGTGYLNELRTELKTGPSEETAEILEYMRKFIANTTMSLAFYRLGINISPRGLILFSNERGESDLNFTPADQNRINQSVELLTSAAVNYKFEIVNHLNENASDTKYTTFFNSSLYEDPNIPEIDDNDPTDPDRGGYYAG